MSLLEKTNIISEVVSFEYLDLYVIAPGIVVSEYKGDFELDLEFAQRVNEEIGKLTNGKAMPQLFVACPGLSVSREVRDWGVTDIANQYTLSSAVVCNLLAHRIIGNFIIRVQKPPRPTRMFTNFPDAIEWLSTFVQ
jgi:hypothetical protein